MSDSAQINDAIFRARIPLTDTIPLSVFLVKGSNYAVWIDSGVKSMFPLLLETMALAGVQDADLRFILHSHSHHDHIGCNAQLKARTGCLIAAHEHYAAWHSDFERHYHEFARGFPDLIPDTQELRAEVLDILDAPAPLDIYLQDNTRFNLGGVSLRAVWLPGHLLAEFGWFEETTRTLILGDAITGLEWPIFHSHLSVAGYRASLKRLRDILNSGSVELVLSAHFPPMNVAETLALIHKADAYIDDIEANLIRILAGSDRVSLSTLWSELCSRMGRGQEFRSLNMVAAHVQDLLERGLIRAVESQRYQLR
jgi:hydroxyacylglutathione hydrolase